MIEKAIKSKDRTRGFCVKDVEEVTKHRAFLTVLNTTTEYRWFPIVILCQFLGLIRTLQCLVVMH